MSRKEAREITFKLVYERCVTGESNALSFDVLTENLSDDDRDYVGRVYRGIGERELFLNSIVQKYSTAFRLERVYKVDLAALLVAAFEILFLEGIPYQISVNEAVELSKKYSTEKSYRFINGILSSIIKEKDELCVMGEAAALGDICGVDAPDCDDRVLEADDEPVAP